MIPLLLSLLIGTIELARVFYTYYTLEKVMYDSPATLARSRASTSAIPPTLHRRRRKLRAHRSTDTAQDPVVPDLTPAMFQIAIERYDPAAQAMTPCDCSPTGCDASQGGQPPDYIQVSLIDGYSVQPFFWGFTIDPFPLRPTVTVPYGGT